MLKQCVTLNGKLINIGPWDYQIRQVQIGEEEVIIEPEREVDGVIIPPVIEKRPIYEDQVTNPLPEGAVEVEVEVEFSDEHGWRQAGTPLPMSQTDKINLLSGKVEVNEGDIITSMIALTQPYEEKETQLAEKEVELVNSLLAITELYEMNLAMQAQIDALQPPAQP